MRHCFCCCEYIFRKINWHIFSRFFPLVFVISLAIVKTHGEFYFQDLVCHFFIFGICVICLLHAIVGFCFQNRKLPTVFWVFDWSALCLEVTCSCFYNSFELFQIEPPARCDFVSSLQTLELVQTKKSLSSHSVRFSTAELNLSSNV